MLLLLRSRVRPLWLLPSAPPPSPSPPLDAHQLSQPQPHPNMQKYPLATTSSTAVLAAVGCSAVQHSRVQCSAVQYSSLGPTVPYCTALPNGISDISARVLQ